MNIYVVREKIGYEGDNVWVVAAETKESAQSLTGAVKYNQIDISLIEASDKEEEQILWQN